MSSAPPAARQIRQDRVRSLVRYLCSKECAGRRSGSEEGKAARQRMIAEFKESGIAPLSRSSPGSGDSDQDYLQVVPAIDGANVLGRIAPLKGAASRSILVAAHYDHLGTAGDGQAFLGADDNAAALAILVEAARIVHSRREALVREVIFAAFDGEEPPHFLTESMGSQHYVQNPPLPLEKLDLMICMDLMGHSLGRPEFPQNVQQTIFVLGAEKSAGTKHIVDRVSRTAEGVRPLALDSAVVPPLSDYFAFEQAMVPFLFLTCGRWRHYHRTSDTPEKLDYSKIAASAEYLAELLLAMSAREEERVTFLRAGHDDQSTLDTLSLLAEELSPHVKEVAKARQIIQAMRKTLARSPRLGGPEREVLQLLVGQLESAIA